MSAARRKGNALELEVARRLQAIDGRDPRLAALETDGGRLGPVYSVQIDVATPKYVVECKSREDNPARLWEWLDKLRAASAVLAGKLGDPYPKMSVLVLKRRGRKPLAVLDLADFEKLAELRRTGYEAWGPDDG